MVYPGEPPIRNAPYVPGPPEESFTLAQVTAAPRVRTGRSPWLVAGITGAIALIIAGAAYILVQNTSDRRAASIPAGAVTSPSTAARSEPSAIPTAPPAAPAGKALGITVTIVAGDASADTTVFAWRQPSASTPEPPAAGYEWGSADIRICARKADAGAIRVSWLPWAVTYADGAVVQPSNVIYGQFPQPEYPQDRVVPVGRCVRGWITFGVPAGRHPQFIEYQPQDGGVTDWLVP